MTNVGVDLFQQINNSVLDLQRAHLQTFEKPLKVLVRLLRDPSLAVVNKHLTENVNFDEFMAASHATGGGMLGSHRLVWPDNPEQELGLTLILLERFSDDPSYMTNFAHQYFNAGTKIISGIHSLTSQLIIPFVRDYKTYVLSNGNPSPRIVRRMSNSIFIVHGHDGEARESVARFIEKIGLKPIILHEQANRGRTVIEKVEANSDVSFAVVILTPDDIGKSKNADEFEARARQNVLLELGYFLGKLGRQNVCALKRGEIEIPSDFAGVVWESMDVEGGWKLSLGRELEAAGHPIDWNAAMRP